MLHSPGRLPMLDDLRRPGFIIKLKRTIIMTQLNQIVAVEKGVKARTTREITDVYHQLKRSADFTGLHRVYQPLDDDSMERLPEESKRVQAKVAEQLGKAADALSTLFDVVATKETGNMSAAADVVVDGTTIIEKAPVPLLLFLEKQITDWRTELRAVPVLDAAEAWQVVETDEGVFRTQPVGTMRSKKVPRNHVKVEATDRHPAQVEVYYEDIPVGRWSTTKLSGAVPVKDRDEWIKRADSLLDALKQAREKANSTEVQQVKIGDAVFSHLLE